MLLNTLHFCRHPLFCGGELILHFGLQIVLKRRKQTIELCLGLCHEILAFFRSIRMGLRVFRKSPEQVRLLRQ